MHSLKVHVSSTGELVLPAEVRERLHLQDGGEVTIYEKDGRIVIDNVAERVRRVQAAIRQYVRPGSSVVDEFIAERRAEAARE